MKDSIQLGTGNSRYLKSAIESGATWEQFRDALRAGTLPIDLNGLNPSGWAQLGNSLGKGTFLKDATAALFGLDESAVPDEVLSWLGKYNEHWWSALHGEAYSYYEKVQTLSTSRHDIHDTSYYSKSIEVNPETGEISLTGEITSLSFPAYTYSSFMQTLCAAAPIYLNTVDVNDEEYFFYIPAGATYTDTTFTTNTTTFSGWRNSGGATWVYVNCPSDSSICPQLITANRVNVPAGETTYEHSADRNAYPDSGTQDGITYTYMGVPFEKFPMMPQIETGSYTGTGTYGASNLLTLNFSARPQFVYISSTTAYYTLIIQRGMESGRVNFNTGSSSYRVDPVTWSDSSVAITLDSYTQTLLNASGDDYVYFAILQ